MVSTMTRRPAYRSLVLAVMVALTLALAVSAVGALALQDGGSATTVTRPAGAGKADALGGAGTAPVALPIVPAVAPTAEAPPQRAFEEWQINEMSARHPEP
jgi:hypothetical protein